MLKYIYIIFIVILIKLLDARQDTLYFSALESHIILWGKHTYYTHMQWGNWGTEMLYNFPIVIE